MHIKPAIVKNLFYKSFFIWFIFSYQNSSIMNKNTVSVISRIVFALVIGYFGFGHLTNAEGMSTMVPSYLPAAKILVYISGVAMLLAAISFIIGVKTKLAGYLLGLLLLVIVVLVHLPSYINGNDAAMVMILKDTAMAAAAFFIGSKGS